MAEDPSAPAEELTTSLLPPDAAGDGAAPRAPRRSERPGPNCGHDGGCSGAAPGDFEAHFTLRTPTSTVHFRGSTLRVIDTDQDQIVLQQGADERGRVLVKRISPGTHAQRALRLGYTLLTVLFLGFLFTFCVQVLLLTFIALPVDSGYTSENQHVDGWALASTVFSIPVMVYGMSSLMTMGSAFVVDTFNGSGLFRSTLIEILYMCVYLIAPFLTFTFCLMTGHDEAWRATARAWAIMVCITFCLWGLAVTVKQVTACFWLVEKHYLVGDISSSKSSFEGVLSGGGLRSRLGTGAPRLAKIAGRALLLTQTTRYSGVRKQRFQFAGTDASSSHDKEPQETSTDFYSWLTTQRGLRRMFRVLEPAKRIYSSEEVRDELPFLTKQNFSMQKMWCSGRSSRRTAVVASGPSALTSRQVQYSVLCTVTSSVVATLLVIGAFVWAGTGYVVYIITAVIAGWCCIIPLFRHGQEMQKMHEDIASGLGVTELRDVEEDIEYVDEDKNLFQVWETERITEPKEWYVYTRVVFEVAFLFVWPFISMMVKHNYRVAVVFLLLGSFTFIWRYFDTSAVLSELGSISDVVGDTISHQEKYRLSEVISRVVSEKGRRRWFRTFMVLLIALLVLLFRSNQEIELVTPQQRAMQPPIPLVADFYYPGLEGSLAYPTCKLSKGFQFPGDGESDLSDYAFLSAIAYEDEKVATYVLDQWFGPGQVADENAFVAQFRTDSNTASSPLYFKMLTFPYIPGKAIVTIRGSETAFDWLSDMQIWSAAGFAQVVKWLTPLGWVWEPIIPDLIYLVNLVESSSISKVSYYTITTKFVNDVMAGYGGKGINDIVVTGTSLGGGLAIITAAQTDAYAVAVSGIGATLSRLTFDPPVDLEKLNTQTFNVIPERDYVALVGGRAPLFQNMDCTAPKNDLSDCHSVWRSLCEMNYKCGSRSRPVYCPCVEKYGYPEPIQNGTRSFQDACIDANSTWYDMFPPE